MKTLQVCFGFVTLLILMALVLMLNDLHKQNQALKAQIGVLSGQVSSMAVEVDQTRGDVNEMEGTLADVDAKVEEMQREKRVW